MLPRACLLTAALIGVGWTTAARGEDWPSPPAPPQAQVVSLGGEVVLNGRRSRIYRFEMPGTRGEALSYFRVRFGSRRVEHRHGQVQVVATQEGDYFHTVQLHDTDQGVQVTLMTTRWRASSGAPDTDGPDGVLMPAKTLMLSIVRSEDGGRPSTLSVAANGHGMQANRDHLVAALQARGFTIVSEDRAETAMQLVFTSVGEEVFLTISDHGAYRSLVVNRTRRLE